jgi:hypothetical protein
MITAMPLVEIYNTNYTNKNTNCSNLKNLNWYNSLKIRLIHVKYGIVICVLKNHNLLIIKHLC